MALALRATKLAVVLCLLPSLLCVLALPAAAEEPADKAKVTYSVGYRIMDFKQDKKTVTVAVWYPTDAKAGDFTYGERVAGKVAVDAEPKTTGAPYPFMAFSHGYGGSGIGYTFFAEALAARGWIVAALDHADKTYMVRIRTGLKGANHFSFNNNFSNSEKVNRQWLGGTNDQLGVITKYGVAFLEKHVVGRADADKVLGEEDSRLTQFQRKE